MKTLFLLRHAKSSWKNPSLSDYDLPLNKRGKNDALLIAKLLKRKGINIDFIISSGAKRAIETAFFFAGELYLEPKVLVDLYLASSRTIIRIIDDVDDKTNSILIVGHNPGITDLVNQISNYPLENLPTSGLIAFSIDGKWKDFGKKKFDFLFYEFPKKYK